MQSDPTISDPVSIASRTVGPDSKEARLRELAEQLKASEERLRIVTESARVGLVMIDRDHRYTYANGAYSALLGLPSPDIRGRHVAEVLGEIYDEQVRPQLERAMVGERVSSEMNLPSGSGLRHFGVSYQPAQPADPVDGVVVVITDITVHRQAEIASSRLAAIVESSDDAIIGKDLNSIITHWNRGAEKIFGYTARDMVGTSILRLIPEDRQDEEHRILRKMKARESIDDFETLRKTRDGRHITVSITASPIEDASGRVIGVSTVTRDITERKSLEQQFLRAQRMESVGTLAGGIAHDLNNVLAPIIMSLDLLKMRFPDSSSQDLLAIISRSAHRGADMVRQVLSFARGVEGRRMEIQVKHLIQEIEKIASDTLLKHIQVKTSVPHSLWTILGDPTQLHQVLLNLCVNARDAMPDGGILTITAENLTLDAQYADLNLDAEPGQYVLIHVEDNGTGMTPEIMEKIFDPFFTTKEVGKGTGLGLSTSLAIIKSHGGFLRVESEPGKGTKFKLHIPARVSTPAASLAEMAVRLPRGQGELILVIDDEDSVRQITQQTLNAYGYRVVLAADGAEAVAVYAIRRAEIVVVITDMNMPVMDGPTTIQILRKMNPALRIIGASGLTTDGHLARAATFGVRHFLPKPYTAETLLRALEEILREP